MKLGGIRDELVENVLHAARLREEYLPRLTELADQIDIDSVNLIFRAMQSAIDDCGVAWNTSALAKIGADLAPLSDFSDDDALLEALLFAIGRTIGPPQLVSDASLRQYWIWAARWARNAFPVVRVSAKQASTFALCDVLPDQYEEIRPPWRAFYVSVDPQFLSSFGGPSGKEAQIRGVAVTRYQSGVEFDGDEDPLVEGSWTFRADFGTEIMTAHHLWSSRRTAEEAYTHAPYDKVVKGTTRLDLREERTVQVICKMALNLCLHMTGRRNISRHRPSTKALRRRGWNGGPVCEEYILGTPVTVDVRRAVREFVDSDSRDGKPLSVQFIVRGHQQRYHYRDGSVRWKLKEPYPKGPETAPILVRPHVVVGAGSQHGH